MTNEEVIRNVKTAFEWWEDNARMEEDEDWSRQHEALDMAIKALEQQPCEDCIRVKKAWRLGYERGIYNATIHEGFTPVAWYTLSDSKIKKVEEKIKALEAQPCEDCISLNKLDDIITKAIDESENQTECQTLRWVLDVMSELTSVTPKQKVGKWIRSWCEWQQYLECSKCGYETGLRCDTKYCPNCGSYNGGEE